MSANRHVVPELLDELAPNDPRAQRARRDLQRVHRAMRSLSIVRRCIARLGLTAPPRQIIELGAGDGTLLLRLAHALHPNWVGVRLTLLDRHDIVVRETQDAYRRLDWSVEVLRGDVQAWAAGPETHRYDLCFTSLFLHHLDTAELTRVLAAVAARCDGFIALEPRRHGLARLGSRLIGLLGANAVTRSDAVASVDAGFDGQEFSALWPGAGGEWRVEEFAAWPFTHCVAAARLRVPDAGGSHAD